LIPGFPGSNPGTPAKQLQKFNRSSNRFDKIVWNDFEQGSAATLAPNAAGYEGWRAGCPE